MNKHLLRLVALVMIPCLTADPASATGLQHAFAPSSQTHAVSAESFSQQTLVGALVAGLFTISLNQPLTAKVQAAAGLQVSAHVEHVATPAVAQFASGFRGGIAGSLTQFGMQENQPGYSFLSNPTVVTIEKFAAWAALIILAWALFHTVFGTILRSLYSRWSDSEYGNLSQELTANVRDTLLDHHSRIKWSLVGLLIATPFLAILDLFRPRSERGSRASERRWKNWQYWLLQSMTTALFVGIIVGGLLFLVKFKLQWNAAVDSVGNGVGGLFQYISEPFRSFDAIESGRAIGRNLGRLNIAGWIFVLLYGAGVQSTARWIVMQNLNIYNAGSLFAFFISFFPFAVYGGLHLGWILGYPVLMVAAFYFSLFAWSFDFEPRYSFHRTKHYTYRTLAWIALTMAVGIPSSFVWTSGTRAGRDEAAEPRRAQSAPESRALPLPVQLRLFGEAVAPRESILIADHVSGDSLYQFNNVNLSGVPFLFISAQQAGIQTFPIMRFEWVAQGQGTPIPIGAPGEVGNSQYNLDLRRLELGSGEGTLRAIVEGPGLRDFTVAAQKYVINPPKGADMTSPGVFEIPHATLRLGTAVRALGLGWSVWGIGLLGISLFYPAAMHFPKKVSLHIAKDRISDQDAQFAKTNSFRARTYLAGVTAGTLLLTAVFASFIDWRTSNPILALTNILLIALLNSAIIDGIAATALRLLPPYLLPEVAIPGSLPSELKTVVYFPILFQNVSELEFFAANLLPSIEQNKDGNIKWVVMSTSPPGIRELERARIQEFQQRYGIDSIFYFHRHEAINNWEKKRGGYMHFLLWLTHSARPDGILEADPHFPSVPGGIIFDEILGDVDALGGTRNFMIGDSDTIWTPGSVKKLVAKIEHPANQRYVIFQGLVENSNVNESILTKYGFHVFQKYRERGASTWKALQRVNYIGHGAGWNIQRFLQSVAGKIAIGYPSHDLVESIFAPTALVSDVTTLEKSPPNVLLQLKQWNRWWLGNKAAARYFARHVRDEMGQRMRNPATLIDRYNLFASSRGYLSALAVLSLVLINMIFGHYILYKSLSYLGIVYAAVLSFELYGWMLTGYEGLIDLSNSIKALGMFLVTTPVTSTGVAGFIVKSLIDDLWARIVQQRRSFSWTPQSQFSTRLTLMESFVEMKYTIALGAFSLLFLHDYMGWNLIYFFGVLTGSPMIVWFTSRPPDSRNDIDKNDGNLIAPPVAPGSMSSPAQRRPISELHQAA